MAINLATKYSGKIDERFNLKSKTEKCLNKEYDSEFAGVASVVVYTDDVVAMNNYTRSGLTRYGTASELGDSIQTLTMTKDRSFTYTIDKGNRDEAKMHKTANKTLKRQTDEVIIPEVDKRRIAVVSAAGIANGKVDTTAPTASTAFSSFLAGTVSLDDDLVPEDGRICWATPTFLGLIRQDPAYSKDTDSAQKMVYNGQVGDIDGVPVIKVPSSYFPANHSFIIFHKSTLLGPERFSDYHIHNNPPGVSGDLIEGRIIYDAFVLANKVDGIYVQKTSA